MIPRALTVLRLLVLPLMALAIGCTTGDAPPQLLNVVDFAPHEVALGDRMEVLGSGFPEGKPAKVVFQGTLHRPGEKPVHGFEIAVDAASTSSDAIEMAFDPALKEAFCGRGDQATHTTFRGDVIVSFPGATPGSLPIVGSVHDAQIDLKPPPPRRAIVEAREAEGERALAFLGLEVASDAMPSGGLLVTGVREGGPSDRAGVGVGDLLVSFDGVRVGAKSDVVPAGISRFAEAAFRRATPPGASATPPSAIDVVRRISVQGFQPSAPPSLLAAGLVLVVAAAAALLAMGPLSGPLTWFERRLAQREGAPSRRSGLVARLVEGARALLREDVGPADADRPVVRLAPYLVFLGVSATFTAMPFGQHLVAADLDVGVLFVLAQSSLVAIALVSGGYGAHRGGALLGGLRSAAQIVACAIPGALAIACIVVLTGSLRIDDVIRAQGAWPWGWFLFRNPLMFAAFLLWLSTSLAEGRRSARELPGAEREPRSARATARTGARELFWFFAEWGNVFVMCGLAAALFLGGWQLPHVSTLEQASRFALSCCGAVVFLSKMWLLVFAVVWMRRALPRLRIDEMTMICLRWLVPASVVALGASAAWVVWSPPATIDSLVGIGTFALWLTAVAWIVGRSRLHGRGVGAEIGVSPFL